MLADLTPIWAAVSGIERDPETGLYPERFEHDPRLELARYSRMVIARRALDSDLDVIATTSDSSTEATDRWRVLAAQAAAAFTVETLDPGREVVERRLSARTGGVLSPACSAAVGRWYGP